MSQQVNTLYFMDNVPVRHYYNPAFQPLSGFYFGLPFLGYSQFEFGNNSLTTSNLIFKNNGQTITFLHPDADKNKFISALKPVTLIGANAQINLLDFGFRHKNAYWTFGVTQKVDANLGLPKDLFRLALLGTPDVDNNSYDFSTLGFGVNSYTEAALGYSKIINEKWSWGLKGKFLYGNANISGSFEDFTLNANSEEWRIKGKNTINASTPFIVTTGATLNELNVTEPGSYSDSFLPNGIGGAIDLGLTYKPFDFLTVSAAITDLGAIRWIRNPVSIDSDVDYTYDGAVNLNGSEIFDSQNQNFGDSLFNELQSAVSVTSSNKGYNTYLSPKLNTSAEIGVLDNKITFGLLSATKYQRSQFFEELTAAFNLKPVNWFNMSLSYSLTNGRWSNIGAGLGMRVGIVNFFAVADYIPVNYAYVPFSELGVNTSIPVLGSKLPVPYKSDRFNLAFGVNLVLGNRQDKDKDGVKDSKDMCPDTPKGVKVDKKGCPIDSDGDGVPDYLDKCPDTPAEANGFVDSNGCPVDTDGDGVFDYLDKCQGTPQEAIGTVDENGCPKDSDHDGVLDYLDKCPNTPDSVKVDANGCPLDEDGDGVPDYLDKCPNTPVEAKGMVDSTGCPLDSDNDGIYDYLDLCPNTPAEAKGMVDKNGCPLDSDDDGVPDYLDKCPNTPVEARGAVDQNGCPRDTDGDGVPDYIDNCPKLFGVASNHGCPEVKKEVRTLFQKALQGIQFESGKDVIKKTSYTILNQIAKVLIDNSNYLIEVQGHTDNVGKPEMNKILSEKRATAVRNYLISKGVDEKRITSNGYGDTKPVASNKTSQGKAKNRRVEFVVTFEEVTFE